MTDKIDIDEKIFVTVFSVLCLMSRMGLTIKINEIELGWGTAFAILAMFGSEIPFGLTLSLVTRLESPSVNLRRLSSSRHNINLLLYPPAYPSISLRETLNKLRGLHSALRRL